MTSSASVHWSRHAADVLSEAGHRTSAPRSAVINALAELGCGATAWDIHDHLRAREERAGLASVYRSLELLHRHELVTRIDVGEGVVRYEPSHPSGDHHHHLLCDTCGAVTAFEDEELERVMARLSRRSQFRVRAHDVTLRGECPRCSAP